MVHDPCSINKLWTMDHGPLNFSLLLRIRWRTPGSPAARTAATTTAVAAAAAASWRRTAQRAWRRARPGITFFRKTTRAFWIFSEILLTLDAGCLGLFVSGRTGPESQRHIQIAPERIGDGHRSR